MLWTIHNLMTWETYCLCVHLTPTWAWDSIAITCRCLIQATPTMLLTSRRIPIATPISNSNSSLVCKTNHLQIVMLIANNCTLDCLVSNHPEIIYSKEKLLQVSCSRTFKLFIMKFRTNSTWSPVCIKTPCFRILCYNLLHRFTSNKTLIPSFPLSTKYSKATTSNLNYSLRNSIKAASSSRPIRLLTLEHQYLHQRGLIL